MSELALCEFGLCKLHLLVRMAKQRWHLCVRDDVSFPAVGLGSELSISVIHYVSGSFCQDLSFLANMTTSVLIDISFKSEEERRMRFF